MFKLQVNGHHLLLKQQQLLTTTHNKVISHYHIIYILFIRFDVGLFVSLLRGWQSDQRGSPNQIDQQGTLSRCIFEKYFD
jgi:hypothetical protein